MKRPKGISSLLTPLLVLLLHVAYGQKEYLDSISFNSQTTLLDSLQYTYQVKKAYTLADSLINKYRVSDFQRACFDFYKGTAILHLGDDQKGFDLVGSSLSFFKKDTSTNKYWIFRCEFALVNPSFLPDEKRYRDYDDWKEKIDEFETLYPENIIDLQFQKLCLFGHLLKTESSFTDSIFNELQSLEFQTDYLRAIFDVHRGTRLGRKGDWGISIKYLLKAKRELEEEKLQQSLIYSFCQRYISNYYKFKGFLEKSIYYSVIQESTARTNQIEELRNPTLANALVSIGFSQYRMGNYASALNYIREGALYLLFTENINSELVYFPLDHLTNSNLSHIYFGLGRDSLAYLSIQNAINDFELARKNNPSAYSESFIAQREALYFSHLAKYWLRNNNPAKALEILEPKVSKLYQLDASDTNFYFETINLLGEIYLATDKKEKATEIYLKLSDRYLNEKSNVSATNFIISEVALAEIYTTLENDEKLISRIELTIQTLLRIYEDLGSFSSEEQIFELTTSWFDLVIPYIKDNYTGENQIELLFDLIEHQKALILIANKSVKNKQDEEVLRKIILEQELFEIEKNEYLDLSTSNNKKDSIKRLLDNINLALPQKEDKKIQQEANLTHLIDNMADHDIMIEYFVVHDDLFALVFTKNKAESIHLASIKKFNEQIDSLRSSIYDYYLGCIKDKSVLKAQKKKYKRFAFALYNQILKPCLIDNGEIRNIKISPIQKLYDIPFEALLKDQDSDSYVLHDYSVSYTPSFTFFSNSTQNRSMDNSFFAPSFDPIQDTICVSELYRANYLGELHYNVSEVEAISEELSGTSYFTNANKSNFLESAKNANILHVATHGKIDQRNDQFSFIAFQNGDKNPDERLYLKELSLKNIDVNCIVLSACETGLGKYYSGEGARSIASSFLTSGSRSVVSSLWSVNDRSTSMVMQNFYKHLGSGKTKDDALRNAKIDYLNQADPDYKHPFYWAGFIAIGDMSPLDKSSNWRYYYSLFGIAIIVFSIGYVYQKRAA